MDGTKEAIQITLLSFGAIMLYLLPWFVAGKRNTKNRSWVAIINIFLGFSVIGWFVALALASSGEKA